MSNQTPSTKSKGDRKSSTTSTGRGKGKGKVSGGGQITKSKRAGLQFPVGRVARYMREGGYAQRIGGGAPVYLAAVLEYLCAELLELAGNAAKDNKKQRIVPRHILLAIKNDDELSILCQNVTISQGGVMPHIHETLLPAKKKKEGGEGGKQSSSGTKSNKSSGGGAGLSQEY